MGRRNAPDGIPGPNVPNVGRFAAVISYGMINQRQCPTACVICAFRPDGPLPLLFRPGRPENVQVNTEYCPSYCCNARLGISGSWQCLASCLHIQSKRHFPTGRGGLSLVVVSPRICPVLDACLHNVTLVSAAL